MEALRKEGISAVRLDSSMTGEEIKAATAEIVSQRVKVLYVTPERFKNEKFRKMLGKSFSSQNYELEKRTLQQN